MTEDRGVFASNDEAPPEFNLHALVHEDLDEGPIGIFPTWRWVYGTVIVFSPWSLSFEIGETKRPGGSLG